MLVPLTRLIQLSMCLLGLFGCTAASENSNELAMLNVDKQTQVPCGAKNSHQQAVADMTTAHMAQPRGIADNHFNWEFEPRLNFGHQMPQGWNAFIPWGQVYAADIQSAKLSARKRVHIRRIQSWYLSKASGQWVEIYNTDQIEGDNYREDFADDVTSKVPADIRLEDEGGISVSITDGYNFHFWPAERRIELPAEDIDGIWVGIETRLIHDDASLLASETPLLISAGADFWKSLDAQWDQFKTNGDLGIGRFRIVESCWSVANMHTLSDDDKLLTLPALTAH